MSNSPSEIQTVHFTNFVPVGAEAIPESRVHQGQLHSGTHTIRLDFDDDPRFILITATNRDTGAVFEQLVSMGAVASVLMKEKRVNKSDSAARPKGK